MKEYNIIKKHIESIDKIFIDKFYFNYSNTLNIKTGNYTLCFGYSYTVDQYDFIYGDYENPAECQTSWNDLKVYDLEFDFKGETIELTETQENELIELILNRIDLD